MVVIIVISIPTVTINNTATTTIRSTIIMFIGIHPIQVNC